MPYSPKRVVRERRGHAWAGTAAIVGSMRRRCAPRDIQANRVFTAEGWVSYWVSRTSPEGSVGTPVHW